MPSEEEENAYLGGLRVFSMLRSNFRGGVIAILWFIKWWADSAMNDGGVWA